MPMRPDLPMGLNLSRRPAAPVRLPRMNFPTAGNSLEGNPLEELFDPPDTLPEEPPVGADAGSVAPAAPVPDPAPAPAGPPIAMAGGQAARVIVYGRSNSLECMEAVQDLIDRQISFTYCDVDRDARAMQHLQAICGGDAVVPVVIQIGYRRA